MVLISHKEVFKALKQVECQSRLSSVLVGSFDNGFSWKLSKKVQFTQKVSVHCSLHIEQ